MKLYQIFSAYFLIISLFSCNWNASLENSQMTTEDIVFPSHETFPSPNETEILDRLWAAENERAGSPSAENSLLQTWREANQSQALGEQNSEQIGAFSEALYTYAATQGVDAAMVQGRYAFVIFLEALDETINIARNDQQEPLLWLENHPNEPITFAYNEACGDFLQFASRILLDENGLREMNNTELELLYRDKWATTFLDLANNSGPFQREERAIYFRWRMESPTLLPFQARLQLLSLLNTQYSLPYPLDFALGIIWAQNEQNEDAIRAFQNVIHSDPNNSTAARYLNFLQEEE